MEADRGKLDGDIKGPHDVVSLVDEIIKRAITSGASDVHFEPGSDDMAVRFRLDGVLNTIEKLPQGLADNIISRLKVLAGLLTYRIDIPQEGRMEIMEEVAGDVSDLRLAVFPTIYGQRAVVRIFHEESGLSDLSQLGLSTPVHESLEKIAASTQGVLILSGPSGSGKSTTLAAMLRLIVRRYPGRSIVALEDPVERRIDGITQIQISPHGELTFPVALRSLLRQDPQVLMVGEIRDSETARIVIEAGLTGHLLMSTLHSGTPGSAVLRLVEMGIEPYQVTSAISAILSQRLVRRLCNDCMRVEGSAYRPVGCDSCFGTGYRGRVLIAEMIHLDGELRSSILSGSDLDELESVLARRGHMTLRQHGMQLMREGVTTLEELDRVCGPSET